MTTTLTRLADSCVLLETADGTTLFDPGFFTWDSHRGETWAADKVDLDSLGDVHKVAITHAHGDHMHPDFVQWLLDRGDDVEVISNDDVVGALAEHDIDVSTTVPDGFAAEDVTHEVIPTGDAPPNRSWTVGDAFTHPGDSWEPQETAGVLALPILPPWGSTTEAVEFAKRLGPDAVVPIHDFYIHPAGRDFLFELIEVGLDGSGIELLKLGWGDSATI